jgi:hypothetical protein
MSAIALSLLVAAVNGQTVASPSLDLSGGGRVATYSGAVDWSRSWSSDWGAAIAGMPEPTIACESSEPLPSATWTATCTGTCDGSVGLALSGTPGARGVLTLTVSGRTIGPPESLDITPVWTPTTGDALTGPSFNVLLPASSIHLWGSTGWEVLRGVYLTTTGVASAFTVPDVYTQTVGTAPGEMVCNDLRSYGTATATGDQHGSAAINLGATCVNTYPSGVPAYVRVVDSVIGGLGTILPVSGCNVGTSILLLSQSVPVSYTGNLTFYPSGQNASTVTATRIGSPTTVTALGYPERWAARLGGVSDYYDLGDIGDASNALTVLVTFKPTNTGGYMVSKYEGMGGDSSYVFYNGAGTSYYFRVCSAPGTCTGSNAATAADATVHVCAMSYTYVSPTTSTIRLNCDGTTVSEVTNATGPLANSARPLRLGSGSATTAENLLAGDVLSSSIWTGTAATAAQLAILVASQQARLVSKPSGSLVTVSSPATTCVPATTATGQLYNLPANSLACGASGCEIWSAAAHSNLLTYSNTFENAAWTKDDGTSVADASASCPTGPLGTAMALFTADGDAEGIGQDGTAGTGRGIWLAYPTGGSACNVTVSDASGDGGATVALTATPTRYTTGVAGQTGIKIAKPAGGCATWCQQAAVVQASLVVGPYVASAAAPVSGTGDVASVAMEGVNDSSGAIGIRFTAPATTALNRIIGLGAGGLLWGSSSIVRFYDVTNLWSLTGLDMTAETTLIVSWDAAAGIGVIETLDGSAWQSGAYDGAFSTGAWTTVQIGGYGDGYQLNGQVRTLCRRGGARSAAVAGVRKCLRGIP